MAKYQFHRMGGDTFQQMVQALLEEHRRGFGELIQFGVGADGGREAVWEQPIDHPAYSKPSHWAQPRPKHWVFQVKYHDQNARGWKTAGDALIADLESELDKIANKHRLICDHYVLVTNVPLSGVRRIGTRDRITSTKAKWLSLIPEIEVWDAADLARMLDNHIAIRSAYSELILPGDVLHALYHQVTSNLARRVSTLNAYLHYIIDNECRARADEAGDEEQLPLTKVFIDQSFQLDKSRIPPNYAEIVEAWSADSRFLGIESAIVPKDLDHVSTAFALFLAAHDKVMLLAGPGYGKSTITQFAALYHAARLVKPDLALLLARRLSLPAGICPEQLDSFVVMRYPFRIELRRYSNWRARHGAESKVGLQNYIADELIGRNVSSCLTGEDIFSVASSNPILLILDGLDEVPSRSARDVIIKDCDAFVYRCTGEKCDLQVVMSSRPQGYNGEFDQFDPLRWKINDLSAEAFSAYSGAWLSERIKNAEERSEAEARIRRGMQSDSIRRLATTLLQATVMLTIVRRKSDIPEERHRLFERYVDVVLQREKSKNELVATFEQELLRLHELVAYRLHEAVGRGAESRLPGKQFQLLVFEVWHALRGDHPSQTAPNAECQAIMTMATDRLVFLSGKGEAQADIDFIIQPYREYFAAQYLYQHTDADPDLVYHSLVIRGAFWANVLQFYVALATPAAQLGWAQIPSERESSEIDDANSVALEVQYIRAALSLLPENVRFSVQQFRKVLVGAFRLDLTWSWLSEGWPIQIVKSVRGGDG